MSVTEYAIATGRDTSPDELAADTFPGCRTVYLGCEVWGMTATFYYLVEQPDEVS